MEDHYRKLMVGYSDDTLLNILDSRKIFEPLAIETAEREAGRRGLRYGMDFNIPIDQDQSREPRRMLNPLSAERTRAINLQLILLLFVFSLLNFFT